MNIPHGNFTAQYDVNTNYLGIIKDKAMAVELSANLFQVCQDANGQFCYIPTPFQPLSNPQHVLQLYTQEPSKHLSMMFTTSKENFRC